MTVATTRNAAVDADLARREAVIAFGLRTFLDVGRELTVIRAQRLYYQDFATFEDYCQERWDFDVRHAQRLMVAASTVDAIEQARPMGREDPSRPIGRTPLPNSESQARELTGLPPEVAAEVMTKAHEDTGGKVTAKAISEAREQRTVAEFITKYPPLAYYATDPKRVIATGTQLDTFSATELPSRLDNLNKHIAADQREAEAPPKPETPDYYAMTDAMFVAANHLCQVIDKQGGADTLAAALTNADITDAQLWIDQFASAVTKLGALTKVKRPTVKSIK